MTKLSPSAQAVLDAYYEVDTTEEAGLVAALRAAARYCKRDAILLLDLADELETTN